MIWSVGQKYLPLKIQEEILDEETKEELGEAYISKHHG